MPSMASIDPKKTTCVTGEVPRALVRWLRLAPNDSHFNVLARDCDCSSFPLTETSNTGIAAMTAAEKTSVIIFGGLLGSDLKVWCILGSLPYLRGFSRDAGGVFPSKVNANSNAWLLYGLEEPNDPMTIEAERGAEERSNCVGMSFWVCKYRH